MANVGRPRVLDEIKRREVCALISAGFSVTRAAQYVGCNPSTIRREALRNEGFYEGLRRAELVAELEPLNLLREKAKTHWRAAAWLLERFNPERFAKQDVNSLTLAQLDEFSERFVQVVMDAIPHNVLQRRVGRRLEAELRHQAREAFAVKRPIRDLPSRRKRNWQAVDAMNALAEKAHKRERVGESE